MINFTETIILGITQGITEWLPISSEGISSLIMVLFWGKNLSEAISISIWLHLGTAFAAILYFRKDLPTIIKNIPLSRHNLKHISQNSISVFLFVSTFATGLLGVPLLLLHFEKFPFAGENAMLIIGVFLIISGIIQFRVSKKHVSSASVEEHALLVSDAFFIGLAQGLAVLPGISRSGITTAYLLIRRYPSHQALKLSFLMSIPVVILAQVLLPFISNITFNINMIIALVISFIFGFLSMNILMRFAAKINFAYFLFFIGSLSVVPFFLKFLQ